MKRLLMLGLAFAAGLFGTAAKADVDVHIGVGVPQVVIGTSRHHDDFRPSARHHRHYGPPVRHYGPPARHYGPPPVYYYPEHVYKHSKRHYRNKRHAHPQRPHVRPPAHWHHTHNTRPLPPPHAYSRGYWQR